MGMPLQEVFSSRDRGDDAGTGVGSRREADQLLDRIGTRPGDLGEQLAPAAKTATAAGGEWSA